jgi:heat shock protein HslJ
MTAKFRAYFPLPLAVLWLGVLSQSCLAGNSAPTPEELASATYSGIEESPVTLTGGRWEGEPYAEGGASRPSVGLAKDFYLQGDLDGDGNDESVALLWQSSGGSGTFDYIAVMDRENDAVQNRATAGIGDRVQVRSGRIEDGLIVLDVVQQAAGEAACCPSQLASRSWSLAGGELIEGEAQVTGTLSLETLDGTEWVLEQMKQDQVMPPDAEVTLFFADGMVSGKSACNRYSAGVEQGDSPRALKIGPAMGTRMACPDGLMELEQQYLAALSQLTGFSFRAGKLVLERLNDGEFSVMVFTAR